MSTDVTTTGAEQEKPRTIAALVSSMGPELQRALPKHLDGDRLARIVLTEIRKNPELSTCEPHSFLGSLLTAASLGLEPGVNGECYLLPYRDKNSGVTNCELVVGYQGVAKLFWQHPLAKRLSAEYVCANDHFKFSKGLTMTLEHTPAPSNRGAVIGYYAIAELSTGAVQYDYFTVDQIKALRGGKVGTRGVADPEHWMERKTALKQVLKLMPKSVTLSHAMRVDETVGSLAVATSLNEGAGLPQLEHADDVAGEQGALDVDGAA